MEKEETDVRKLPTGHRPFRDRCPKEYDRLYLGGKILLSHSLVIPGLLKGECEISSDVIMFQLFRFLTKTYITRYHVRQKMELIIFGHFRCYATWSRVAVFLAAPDCLLPPAPYFFDVSTSPPARRAWFTALIIDTEAPDLQDVQLPKRESPPSPPPPIP